MSEQEPEYIAHFKYIKLLIEFTIIKKERERQKEKNFKIF